MAFCRHCGKDIGEDNFCYCCGAPVNGQQHENNTENAALPADYGYNRQSDIQKNRIITILAYIGILVLIPLFAARQSKFARYHAKQGLALFICEFIFGIFYGAFEIVFYILSLVLSSDAYEFYEYLFLIFAVIWVLIVILAIIGIINVLNGKTAKLPVIGKLNIFK